MLHTKTHLRSLYLQKRASLSAEQATRASHAVAEILLAFPGLEAARVVAGYFPIRHELDILPALNKLHRKGHGTALPVIRHIQSPLEFHRWKPGETLVKSALFKSVWEPSPSSPILVPDIILVPLVAFDRKGFRLGYGSGAYDRTLAASPNVVTIGIGFAFQEAEALPHISFDQRVDYVITEKEIITSK